MSTRVDTTLSKKITIEIVGIGNDNLGEYVTLEISGTGRPYPDIVPIYKGHSLTLDIPMEVHIGW